MVPRPYSTGAGQRTQSSQTLTIREAHCPWRKKRISTPEQQLMAAGVAQVREVGDDVALVEEMELHLAEKNPHEAYQDELRPPPGGGFPICSYLSYLVENILDPD